MLGLENTAVGTFSWSMAVGSFLNSVRASHIASAVATGVRLMRLVTSPMAWIESTLLREYLSTITAPSAAVIEASTGTVVYAKNAQQERGMASTTKLMTALVALDHKPLTSVFTSANYHPTAAETRLGLHPGERMTLADLVRAMMLPSANDAAQTVAMRTGGTVARFVAMMNARAKDEGRRCDLEAGMAKLLGARVAWAAADNALQIHGGNGFALEYPISRVLCDARILNIFEGAAEIQAQVIARRLLEGGN